MKGSKGLAGHFRKMEGQVDPAGPQPEMILIGLCTHTSPQCVPEDLNFLSNFPFIQEFRRGRKTVS